MNVLSLHQGTAPVLISLPHDGVGLAAGMVERMTDSARALPDTDWFVSRLYAFGVALGASVLVPSYSRYVVDLNRPPDDASLYPGQNTTGLCPTQQFNGEPIYLPGEHPGSEEIAGRIESYWLPYHQTLRAELDRLRALHGRVLLWEGHSIKSRLPFLFDGRLPDINLGTASGASCAPATQQRLESALSAQSQYSWIGNGRFKGGYITRHYGRPEHGIDAMQLELAQCNYMDEERVVYDELGAGRTQALLQALLRSALG
ncbi:MAG: N-formylglutamate deformylase [Arenimonas sp.]